MSRPWLWERMRGYDHRSALVGDGYAASYADLLRQASGWAETLTATGVDPGRVVAIEGDCSDRTIALLLALMARDCIAVPLASTVAGQKAEFLELAQAEFLIDVRTDGPGTITVRGARPGHPLIDDLAARGTPGLVLFSSGSTGRPKAILHDLDRLLAKYEHHRPPLTILAFLLLDHIGGINTILHGLAHGGTVVAVGDRRPAAICRSIERHRVEVLPTSPTFLNLLLLSGEHRRHDLSSLRTITYGTEVMPASTLERLQQEFPGVRLQQTYGLSELGILRTKSRDDGSLWVKVGGEGYETRVVDGILWVRARSALVGYLNAPSPFDQQGWFNTKDAVEQDGEWIRFLGRATEIINVGGQKVYPAEIENALLEMDGVLDATVRGEPNPLLGQCVVARVNLARPEPIAEFKARMRRHLHGRLAPYAVPVKVELADTEQYNSRMKRVRNA
jgi:acyl-coenzyme A synthetase/AMP-(fatty) acid ligase